MTVRTDGFREAISILTDKLWATTSDCTGLAPSHWRGNEYSGGYDDATGDAVEALRRILDARPDSGPSRASMALSAVSDLAESWMWDAERAEHAPEHGYIDQRILDEIRFRAEAGARILSTIEHITEGEAVVVEWAILRKHDGDDAAPVESFRFASREAAERSIANGYTQPEFWEARGRVVGEWTTDPDTTVVGKSRL